MTARRIAYVLTRFPKVSETFVTDEMLALERRGFHVEVCSLRPGRAAAASAEAAHLVARRLGFAVLSPAVLAAQLYWLVRAPVRWLGMWRLAIARHAGSPAALAAAVLAVSHAAALAIRLRRRGVGHVHAHWATHSALAAWAIHRLSGLPYSFTTHADDLFVRRPMLEEKVSEARFVVAISEFGRRFLLRELRHPERARVRVVHCGVATDAFRPLAPAPRRDPFTIACVARLEPKKGHAVLLDACLALADPRLAGRIDWQGARPRAAVREVLAGAHVFALPCVVAPSGRADGIPVALMEAMALGRPVVSTTVSGIPELVQDGRSGLLVPPGDPLALADALERLHADPDRAARLAAGGRRRVEERFDLDGNVGRLAALFEAEISGPAPAAALGVRAEAPTG